MFDDIFGVEIMVVERVLFSAKQHIIVKMADGRIEGSFALLEKEANGETRSVTRFHSVLCCFVHVRMLLQTQG